MARLLLIDDDPALLELLGLALSAEGNEVLLASNGLMGYKQAANADLIVSDVNMPGMDGFTLCRKLRAEGNRVPMILLTARDSEIDEALGLDLGADDYVHKPFRMRVLQSRIAALLRRDQPPPADVSVLVCGALLLDPHRLSATWKGILFSTTVSEFRLIGAMASQPGIVHNRQVLMEKMRGDDSVVVERIVDTYIRRIRRTIETIDPAFNAIETLIGAGYRWRDPPP